MIRTYILILALATSACGSTDGGAAFDEVRGGSAPISGGSAGEAPVQSGGSPAAGTAGAPSSAGTGVSLPSGGSGGGGAAGEGGKPQGGAPAGGQPGGSQAGSGGMATAGTGGSSGGQGTAGSSSGEGGSGGIKGGSGGTGGAAAAGSASQGGTAGSPPVECESTSDGVACEDPDAGVCLWDTWVKICRGPVSGSNYVRQTWKAGTTYCAGDQVVNDGPNMAKGAVFVCADEDHCSEYSPGSAQNLATVRGLSTESGTWRQTERSNCGFISSSSPVPPTGWSCVPDPSLSASCSSGWSYLTPYCAGGLVTSEAVDHFTQDYPRPNFPVCQKRLVEWRCKAGSEIQCRLGGPGDVSFGGAWERSGVVCSQLGDVYAC